jgi:hypothetical protein
MLNQIFEILLANKEFDIEIILCNLPWVHYPMLATVCKEIPWIPCFTIEEDLNLSKKPMTFCPHSCFWIPLDMTSNIFVTVLLSGFHEIFELLINHVNSHQILGIGKSIEIVAYM